MTAALQAYEAPSGLHWHQSANGHWHARGLGGDFDAVPLRSGGFMLLWLPDSGGHVDLGQHGTLMGFDSAASAFARPQGQAAEQPGRSYGPRRYLWKVTFIDASGARSFEIVEGETEQEAVAEVKKSLAQPAQRFLFAKRLAAAAEGAEQVALAEDGCAHTHPPGVPSTPCASPEPEAVIVQHTEVVAAGKQTTVATAGEKAALRFTEVSFDKRADAERFARFLERRHSTIVAMHSNLIVTTNATGADIHKVLKAHKWEGGHRVGKSAGHYDLAAEAERRREKTPPKARRAKRKR